MRSTIIGARRTCALAAAGVAAVLAAPHASADELSAAAIQSDAYLMARLNAGHSWDGDALSLSELRPGKVDQGQLESYVAMAGAAKLAGNLELIADLGPQIVTDDGEVLTMQTASATWGESWGNEGGVMPRAHLAADGVWEFPRLPSQDELDLLVGQRWRVVESIESQILFLGPDRKFGWDDLGDLVNPLQHIPLVNIAYRAITGDHIYGAASLIDMGFGPLAGAGTVFQLAYESTTGQNLEDQAIAAVFGPRATEDSAAVYTTASGQVADRRLFRRGSNQ